MRTSAREFVTAARAMCKPAGENPHLDEIRVAPVGVKTVMLNRDDLQACEPTRTQAIGQALEKDRPVLFADRFEHLDGCDFVELAGHIAIVLQPDFNTIGKAGFCNFLACPFSLRR